MGSSGACSSGGFEPSFRGDVGLRRWGFMGLLDQVEVPLVELVDFVDEEEVEEDFSVFLELEESPELAVSGFEASAFSAFL